MMMLSFHYRAIDREGRLCRGQLHASHDRELTLRLHQQGLELVSFRVSRKRASSTIRVNQRELLTFCIQLEQLLSAGVPMLQALDDIRAACEPGGLQLLLAALIQQIESGQSLSQAMHAYPGIFGPVFINLVAAGEHSGQLTLILQQLASSLSWEQALRSQGKHLLAYPAFVLVVVLAVVIFLLNYMVPQMASFLSSLGQELPLQTRILIASADLMRAYWPWILSVLAGLTFVTPVMLRRHPGAALYWDRLTLRLPVCGELLKKMQMARYARNFSLMYQAGIPVLQILALCRALVSNRSLALALHHIEQHIHAGTGLAESFQRTGSMPALVVRMVRVGEQTGALDRALLNVSRFYEREVNDAVDTLLRLVEPLLTVILGLLLAGIMFAVLSPVYDSLGHLPL
ncbi:type II secretion system F family protein [Pseudomethylobacillus aquaticus]|uniref:Type II secretion system F family protein n=1 Tax=Pseudomethylobacillus aquaticus TaxID=2676064 RepID=A0A3N0UZ60_9PROT|nr:type II secretion system F family protein [Pseudomethylobacillus aquaticus]ROH85783.1 type II secretion system F family protein [Pseudomethylobacillus aquaticus]